MDENRPSVHKRGKSGIARSLLSRASNNKPELDTNGNTMNPTRSASPSTRREPGSPLSQSTSLQDLPARPPPPASTSSAPPSIEQSVKLFRIYEALRKGDTAAITKAIRDESSSSPIEARRGSATSATGASGTSLEGTTLLHLAVQCADVPVIEYVLGTSPGAIDINGRDKDGNTPLHIASSLTRGPVVRLLLDQPGVNDTIANYQGKTALDLAKTPEVFQQLQLARSMYVDDHIKQMHQLVASGGYQGVEKLLMDPHFQSAIDVNGGELATDAETTRSGGTLLHEAARKKDGKLIEVLLLNGADPFRRDRKGKLPQDVTKDDRIRGLLKKSPAAAVAQRGIQEKTILGTSGSQATVSGGAESNVGGKEAREMKGYLKKWTNYTSGYKLRWFVLEDGVMSYYKHQDDAGSACRGAINMRIARLHMDATDKLRFEIHGKSSVKYHLKANHQVEAKRWFWALNNAIQWTKDEAREEQKRTARSAEIMRQAKTSHVDRLQPRDSDDTSARASHKSLDKLVSSSSVTLARSVTDDDDGNTSVGEPSVMGDDYSKHLKTEGTVAMEQEADDEEEYGDDASSVEAQPVNRDAFMIAAQSARLQLDLLSQITLALQRERSGNEDMSLSDPTVTQALASYEAAIANLRGLIGDLGRIGRDREAYWHYRLEQEINMRRIWEDSMAKVAKDQEELEKQMYESEEKRKRTKRALKDALEGHVAGAQDAVSSRVQFKEAVMSVDANVPPTASPRPSSSGRARAASSARKISTIEAIADISDSDSDNDEEFFDAVGAGEVDVKEEIPADVSSPPPLNESFDNAATKLRAVKASRVESSYKGYEEPVRKRLKLDADNRPRISLWGILKSMIGKDMTKMTLPVSFNEPTSLLYRVAEDMEYTDLLDVAADRADSTERLLYVAAFAASEYASTIGRVAKPFNPLLGETYEYVRPDKGFRFMVEQVSHHPPVGAAWAESAKWDYYGESAVKSKFYGKAFDINPLGTWFLKLRPTASVEPTANGEIPSTDPPEELYTWKKVTSSVIGIITGTPTVDNYGPMEIKNHTTGETCLLDFKPRGWKASSAYQVSGKVLDRDGLPRWSIGGRWNDRIYARLTPGYESVVEAPGKSKDVNQAFLVWEAHARPQGIPFNLTPFVVTLNALPDTLRPWLPPTDSRLRPDQRAMEDGEYDLAATEKNRVEEKQRSKRREREAGGEEYEPKWFKKALEPTTGEAYWEVLRTESGGVDYWDKRERAEWQRCEGIF
ncbi:MAG: hypothetical protein Q9162_002772 [Coniocarpon cinnabarinum]